MFKNISTGGAVTLAFFLIAAGVAGFFGFRDNATHGDGAGNFVLAAVFAAIGIGAGLWDARRQTARLNAGRK